MTFDQQLKEFVETERDNKPAGRRERIATAALQGLLAAIPRSPFEWNLDGSDLRFGTTASVAVEFADALIAEMDKEK